jgi:hypothetical protein
VTEKYLSGAPTATEIVCLFLYGQRTPPAFGKLRTYDDIMAYAKVPAAEVEIDKYFFMVKGGGRFASIGRFDCIINFLKKKDNLPGGINAANPTQQKRYSLMTFFNLIKVWGSNQHLRINQYDYFQPSERYDFVDRCEVFGSSEFEINPAAEFFIEPNGDRWIKNIWIDPVEDNFDYTSNAGIAKFSNGVSKPNIDPLSIGRTVIIKFTGNYRKYYNNNPIITGADLPKLEKEADGLIKKKGEILRRPTNISAIEDAAYAASVHLFIMNQLEENKVFYLKNIVSAIPSPTLIPRDFIEAGAVDAVKAGADAIKNVKAGIDAVKKKFEQKEKGPSYWSTENNIFINFPRP